MVKESCHLIRIESPLDSPKQKWQFQKLPFTDDYPHDKNLRYHLIPAKDINDQRMLQSDWTKSTAGQTQPKMVVSDVMFH